MPKMVDITGRVYGRLTVVCQFGKAPNGNYEWLAVCSCGRRRIVRQGNLQSGNNTSCNMCSNITHGHAINRTHTPEYGTWHAMLQRCYNSKNKKFYLYGGRGIRVCRRW